MYLTADLTDVPVLVLGDPHGARRALRRYAAAGASVRSVPAPEQLGPDDVRGAALAVVVGDGARRWREVLHDLGARVPVAFEPAAQDVGRVTLVGGGPGADDLLTVRAVQALQGADVVLVDRLAPAGAVAAAAPGAHIIPVGKTPGHHPVPQSRIQEAMVEHALEGRSVVRLKGGDPYVFGRGGEELAACAAHGIPVDVVPGVTSAVSVPGAAGIPVTFREVSRMFTVASGHVPFSEQELAHFAGLGAAGGTLVVLMGMNTLPHLVAGLVRAGADPATPLAVVEKGFTDQQRSTVTTLADAVADITAAGCGSPAVVVVGPVVRLASAERDAFLAEVTAHGC
ncbi:uroporphyrinogen-III C-methyltransferase [Kocuria rosea]|uniref:uroporphyrinogen-III C-methyltransferase n=1 Tax=Kocuria rosea TaxID=1275 RepID=UPI002041C3C0|nr:uroporphyrinogen-III C-methyltransferase [Kocuria rosea]MCM3687855.1 uroporphyrinogen-III C-methyltransferase [Kocuria rosea]